MGPGNGGLGTGAVCRLRRFRRRGVCAGALQGSGADRLLWLRKRIWWGLNDRYRSRFDGSPLPDVPTWPQAAERSNMEAILDMLRDGDVQPGDRIQQGELLRLLGRFDDAVAVLKTVRADGHEALRAVRIEQLARRGDAQVRMLSPPTW